MYKGRVLQIGNLVIEIGLRRRESLGLLESEGFAVT